MVWLFRALPGVGSVIMRTFYRLHVVGEAIPAEGPLLLVANHPNLVADPGCVLVAARRPVHFLAKSTLYLSPVTAWLLRSAGAVAVYRRQDDPTQIGRNEETFREVFDALEKGAAVGIFPEGISHSEPSLAPLKSGAARIALAAARDGARPEIIPIGLTYRRKDRFRSEAVASVGKAVEWSDLLEQPESGAVRELTERIDDALRGVTINLERWEDRPAVEAAEAIYAAENRLADDPESRVARQRMFAESLTRMRAAAPERVTPVFDRVTRYAHLLRELRLTPSRLTTATRLGIALRWTAGRLLLFVVALPALILGLLLFTIPYQFTAAIARRMKTPESRAAFALLGGAAIFLLWLASVAVLAWIHAGAAGAAFVVLAAPAVGLATLWLRDWWEESRREARRFFLLRGGSLRVQLLEERRELAQQIEALRRELM